MSRGARSVWTSLRRVVGAGLVLGAVGVAPAAAQQSVSVDLPAVVGFVVADVGSSTAGSTTTVSFADASLDPGKVLRVWVKADAASFTPPASGASSVAASKVSWSPAAAHNGIGSSGALSSVSWTLLFESDAGQTSGWAEIDWSLAALDGRVRAGNHQVSLRWKLEAVTP